MIEKPKMYANDSRFTYTQALALKLILKGIEQN